MHPTAPNEQDVEQATILYADPAFGCLHCVEVGCVADISEEHTASIIKEVRRSHDDVPLPHGAIIWKQDQH
jgi:hypothetical protein